LPEKSDFWYGYQNYGKLILGGMNSLGEEDVNEGFIKKLYGLINGKKKCLRCYPYVG
jgi:hypothetical protein